MKTEINTDVYESAIFASAVLQEGNPSDWKTFYVLYPNCKRLTDSRRLEIAEFLWGSMGKDLDLWHNAPEKERLRWARNHMGRYKEVAIKNYDDGTFQYTTESSGGGDYPQDRLVVL